MSDFRPIDRGIGYIACNRHPDHDTLATRRRPSAQRQAASRPDLGKIEAADLIDPRCDL